MHYTENLILPLIMLLFIMVVVLVAVVVLSIVFNKKSIKLFAESTNDVCNKYKNEIKQQNDIFIQQLLEQESNQNNSNVNTENIENNKNLMSVFIKLRSSIKENCITAMNKIGSDRIAIYLFHNGTHSTHGISFFKMSCICEKVAVGSGVRERMIEHTNIPINLFDDMIEKLITNDRYIIMNNEETQATSHKLFISSDKIKYTQIITIYDINNNMLGFVAAEMDKIYSKDEVDKEREVLNELVKQLVPVLSYSDYISIKA